MPSPLVHFQIASTDPEAAAAFFQEVFDWRVGPGGGGAIHSTIDTGARSVEPNDIYPAGAFLKVAPGGQNFASLFFRVEDIDATIAKASSLGAKVVVPRTLAPGGQDVAIFISPQGHSIGLVQL